MKNKLHLSASVLFGTVILGLLVFGCAHTKTMVFEIPPRIDLQTYQTIGIVEFTSNSSENLNKIATQKFMTFIQNAQPQVRFLELGSENQLVKKLGRDQIDLDSVKAIKKKFGISTIFTGSYEISEMKPKVSIGMDMASINASADVNISMVTKHWDTETGATIWTNSRSNHWKVAGLHKDLNDISFSISVPEDQYSKNIEELAYSVTDPFRPHYERRTVPEK